MKRVIVIGGGFAGSEIAKGLEDKFKVSLIDNKEYFEFTPSVLRVVANPRATKCIQLTHSSYLKKTEVLLGDVKEISDKFVLINGKKIKFDYLVVATGSSYKFPFKNPKLFLGLRARELVKHNEQISSANSFAVIGGGPVGVEMAAELSYYFPEKKVILVASKPVLLERMPSQAQEYAKNFLLKNNVKILFNEMVMNNEGKLMVTEKGTKIDADYAFACMGIEPNSKLFAKSFKNSLGERGFVNVDENLRLNGKKNVFVAGDLVNIPEEKTAQNAERHAKLVVENIMRVENGKNLLKYQSKKTPMVVSLGPRDGIFVQGSFVMTGIIPALLKWFVEKKEMLKKRF